MKLFNKEYKVLSKRKGIKDIVIKRAMSKWEIIDLCKDILVDDRLKVLKVYSSKMAWQNERKQIYDDIYAEGFLVHCSVNSDGFKLTWVQEIGDFAHLQGEVMDFYKGMCACGVMD